MAARIWIAGGMGGTPEVYVSDDGGTVWSSISTSLASAGASALDGIHGVFKSNVLAQDGADLYRYDGATWAKEACAIGQIWRAMAGQVASYAGDRATPGNVWRKEPSGAWAIDDTHPAGQDITSLAIVEGSDIVFAASTNYGATLVVKKRDGSWSAIDAPTTLAEPNGLWAVSATSLWMANDDDIAHWIDGSGWTVENTTALDDLRAIWMASDSFGIAVGANGAGAPLIYTFNGSSWATGSVPGTVSSDTLLAAVYGISATEAYAAGYDIYTNDPCLLKWDGSSWSHLTVPINTLFGGVWISPLLPPVVDPSDPVDGETHVAPGAAINFTLTDDVAIVDGWQAEVKRGAGHGWETALIHLESPQFKAGWQGPASQLSTLPGGFDVTLDPLEPFDRGAAVQVRVTAVDDEGNPCVLYGAGGATSYNGNPQDTIVVTEAVLAEVIYERQPLIPERVVLEETLLAETEYIRSVEDTVAVTDDVYLCSPEDTVAVTETMLAETEYIRSIEDAVAVTDDVCLIDPSDIVEVSDTVSRTLEGSRAAADTIEVTDAVGPELGVFCADGAVLEETLLVEMDYARAAADTVAVTDDVYLVDPSDAVVLTDDVLAEKL